MYPSLFVNFAARTRTSIVKNATRMYVKIVDHIAPGTKDSFATNAPRQTSTCSTIAHITKRGIATYAIQTTPVISHKASALYAVTPPADCFSVRTGQSVARPHATWRSVGAHICAKGAFDAPTGTRYVLIAWTSARGVVIVTTTAAADSSAAYARRAACIMRIVGTR